MTFNESIKKLGIESFGERIFNSNSHGELFHLTDYINLANHYNNSACIGFRAWFELTVEKAEKTWDRPESVFQHIPKLLDEFYSKNKN